MSAFAAEFRRLVMPALIDGCRVQGLLLALDIISFSEAFDQVMGRARRRGANYLPADLVDRLQDWICCSILEITASNEEEIEEAGRRADRVAHQVAAFERAHSS